MATMDDLVRQVQDLEGATTDLLDATNLSKQTLDEAVDSAKGSAGSAKTDAGTASEKAGESVTARNEAVQAKDDAVAVVYEGDAILTPTPGSIPIADSKAKIDNGWLPFGEVNNPYSGVIGSVAKSDLFAFYTDQGENWANRIQLNKRSFNIGGRFVETAQAYLELPEAEDTAERAIAFDDVFLDWNGNIDNYRSITPHRTSTGYDADQIAAEHGYSKVSNGLYKTGDSYALLLCRVARRNQGAYHPLWNPEGTVKGRNQNENGIANWYLTGDGGTNVKPITSTELCFDIGGTGHADTRYGIENGPVYCGRPSSIEYCDAIYATDVTPLYFSAANVTDRQALLFDSFNKAVAGETFMGAEGTNLSVTDRARVNGPTSIRFRNIARFGHSPAVSYYPSTLIVYNHTQGHIVELNDNRMWIQTSAETEIYIKEEGAIVHNDICTLVISLPEAGIFKQTQSSSARPQFLACDIIGSLDAMPQEWLEHGIPGNWLAVGEEGEDLIPDGTEKNFKLSRKCLECYLVIYTRDNGATWGTATTAWKSFVEGARNSKLATEQGTTCLMVFYRTSANPFELTNNSTCLEHGNCIETDNGNIISRGVLLGTNLINKIPTGGGDPTHFSFPLIDYSINPFGIDGGNGYLPSHRPLRLNVRDSPAFKALPYLSNNSYFHVIYKELKSSDSVWGDNSKFNVPNNQTTVIDLNGETIIVGQKRVQLPYHPDGVTL